MGDEGCNYRFGIFQHPCRRNEGHDGPHALQQYDADAYDALEEVEELRESLARVTEERDEARAGLAKVAPPLRLKAFKVIERLEDDRDEWKRRAEEWKAVADKDERVGIGVYRRNWHRAIDERDEHKAKREEAEANAAAMRDVVESFLAQRPSFHGPKCECLLCTAAKEALSTNAGAALLARAERAIREAAALTRAEEAEASAAAMREALIKTMEWVPDNLRGYWEGDGELAKAALSTSAGRALLERVEKMESALLFVVNMGADEVGLAKAGARAALAPDEFEKEG